MEGTLRTAHVARGCRFLIDEVPLASLVRHAYSLTWTRDPFDRLLAAHSGARSRHPTGACRRHREAAGGRRAVGKHGQASCHPGAARAHLRRPGTGVRRETRGCHAARRQPQPL